MTEATPQTSGNEQNETKPEIPKTCKAGVVVNEGMKSYLRLSVIVHKQSS
jgi:hypothetical protein